MEIDVGPALAMHIDEKLKSTNANRGRDFLIEEFVKFAKNALIAEVSGFKHVWPIDFFFMRPIFRGPSVFALAGVTSGWILR